MTIATKTKTVEFLAPGPTERSEGHLLRVLFCSEDCHGNHNSIQEGPCPGGFSVKGFRCDGKKVVPIPQTR